MTIPEQIKNKLQLKESCEVEYKSAAGGFPVKEFWITFSAFANTNGGTIVLGVKQKGKQFIPDGLSEELVGKYRKQFWDDAHNKSCVNYPMLVESDVQEFETEGGQRLLIFRVPRASHDMRPIFLHGNPLGNTYKRRDEGDYQCSDDEVRQMFSDANNMRQSADSRILRNYTMDDIDLPTLQQYRRAYDKKHEDHPWTMVDDMKFLENIGAYRKDRVNSIEGFTVAGMLMFGKTQSITDPECCQEFFPDYRERLSDDPQIRWTNRVYPDGTWEANLYQFFTRVLPMLQHALPVPFSLDEQQRRNETTTAHTSLREALANSLIHAAYTVRGNVVIDRYFDRIVISNPGTMLVSLEEFYEGGHSICRNPLLQKMFVFLGIGEKGGTGADVIAKGWADNGWAIPTLCEKTAPDRVETVLYVSEKALINNIATEIVDKHDFVNKITEKLLTNTDIGDKLAIRLYIGDNLEVNETAVDKMAEIMLYLSNNPRAKSTTLAEHMGMSASTSRNYLNCLLVLDFIVTEGANKNRVYSLKIES
ncbi:MAG: putative DNA binding domain-containing protein [Bacteroidales bacterium]|nr:putative DNA binding domain-containing protein [Candidatus Physcocola equi]